MLSTLYRDERSAALDVFPFLEKVYLEHILRRCASEANRGIEGRGAGTRKPPITRASGRYARLARHMGWFVIVPMCAFLLRVGVVG
jgi:hypothetical protein